MGTRITFLLLMVICFTLSLQAQQGAGANPPAAEIPPVDPSPDYRFGPEDVVTIWVRDAPEISEKQFRVDPTGILNMPLVGRLKAEGLTRDELQVQLTAALRTYIREPEVVINVTSTRAMSISILGGVRNPGTHQFRGTKNLLEMISTAGGLTPDASQVVRITRRNTCGEIPGAIIIERTAEAAIGELDLTKVLEGSPERNIPICAEDIVFVPRMTKVFVIGEVARQGGYEINDNDGLSVLQVLSLAGGVTPSAVTHEAKILRPVMGGPKQAELALDVKSILDGKAPDVLLRPNDVLFIPNSATKGTAMKTLNRVITGSSSVLAFTALRLLFR